MAGVGTAAQVQAPQLGAAAQVAAPPQDSAYYTALQQSLAPGFQLQGQQLAGQEAAMGVLNSGQGVNDFGTLAANQNATYAGLAAPMIDQGFQQQFAANQQNAQAANTNQQLNAQYQYGASGQNAGAQNSLQQLLQQQQFQAGQTNQADQLQANEFNSGQQYGLLSQNLGYQNALQQAQLGYGNSDYLAQLGAISGLEGTGLNSLGNVIGTGQGNQFYGYGQGAAAGAAAGQATGYNAGYGTPTFNSSIPGLYSGGQSSGVDTSAPWSNGNGNDGYYGTGGA